MMTTLFLFSVNSLQNIHPSIATNWNSFLCLCQFVYGLVICKLIHEPEKRGNNTCDARLVSNDVNKCVHNMTI